MPYLEKGAVTPLVSALATCGGVHGPLFLVAKTIKEHGEGALTEMLGEVLAGVAADSIGKLEALTANGRITPATVLARYGHPDHFWDMDDDSQKGQDSVAREIPPDIRAVAHTLLPVRNGVYSNEGRIISFKGLVPLGPQEGNLVAHLGGIFSSGCSDREISSLLEAQARDMEFLKKADAVGTLDYDGTKLQRATIAAKKQLGL